MELYSKIMGIQTYEVMLLILGKIRQHSAPCSFKHFKTSILCLNLISFSKQKEALEMSLDLLFNIKFVERLNIQIMATRILGTFSLPHTSLGGVTHTALNTNYYPLGQVAKMLQFQSNLKLEQVSKALGDQSLMSLGVYKARDGEHFNFFFLFIVFCF